MITAKLSLTAFVAVIALAACTASTDPTSESPPDSTSSEISVAKCKGMLPHICEVCGDGTSACAHWAVKNKKCAVEICATASTCVQHVICATNNHFDHTVCKCVPNMCIENVLCAMSAHFDHTTCGCVPN